ncbi:MAG: hypothetical protein ACRDND_33210, partial [Streptosporangiaceae bacterium]
TVLARLQRAERAHHRNQDALAHAITQHEQDITGLTALGGDIDTAIARRQDTRGDKFTMTVDGHPYAKRAEAGLRLKDLLQQEVASLDGLREHTTRPGHLGGFPVTTDITRALGNTTITLGLDGAPGTSIRLSPRELAEADPARLITRLENRLARLDENKTSTLAGIGRARREIAHARDSIDKPFPQAAELSAAREHARQIDEQLEQMAAPPHPEDQPVSSPPDAAQGQPGGGPGRGAPFQATEPEAGAVNDPGGPDRPDPAKEDPVASARQEPAADDRHYRGPARDAAERVGYDRPKTAQTAAEADEERFTQFRGRHVQDPSSEHGNRVDSRPRTTPEQAGEQTARRDQTERQDEAYEAEIEAGC